ncbi:hypothetical protein ACFL0X_00955 [Nanoarchaeota archaeon]
MIQEFTSSVQTAVLNKAAEIRRQSLPAALRNVSIHSIHSTSRDVPVDPDANTKGGIQRSIERVFERASEYTVDGNLGMTLVYDPFNHLGNSGLEQVTFDPERELPDDLERFFMGKIIVETDIDEVKKGLDAKIPVRIKTGEFYDSVSQSSCDKFYFVVKIPGGIVNYEKLFGAYIGYVGLPTSSDHPKQIQALREARLREFSPIVFFDPNWANTDVYNRHFRDRGLENEVVHVVRSEDISKYLPV